ncbi:MAG: hypothetical protein CMJ85_03565 [Planctomycetes bacterium]|nr:hypothetical protein [Planctomycetota bacterium]
MAQMVRLMKRPLQCIALCSLVLTGVVLTRAAAQDSPSWTGWRGPLGTGVAPGGNPPTEWGEDKNIRWKVAVPGNGHSTPIILGDRIYLTAAIATDRTPGDAGEEQAQGNARRGGFMNRRSPTKVHEFIVVALDRKDGKLVWRTKVTEAVPHEAGHRTASQASNSPLTDGERIYAYFGSRGIHCLDMQGKVQWSKQLGKMRTAAGFGEGSSPALYGDTLVVNWDHEGDSFVVAFDTRTGKERWRTPRDERTSWSTPLIVEVSGKPQVIISASYLTRAYDLETGKVVWACEGLTGNCIPTPMHANGIVYVMSGFRGFALQAIKLEGSEGDIDFSEQIKWTHNAGTPYTPSGLVHDGLLYFLRSNNAILSCLDAKTGKVHYEGQRLRGMRTVYASLVGAGGRVYVTSRGGTTKVIKLGAEFEELASNDLEDTFDASAAIVGDELYLRGKEHLYCIARQ